MTRHQAAILSVIAVFPLSLLSACTATQTTAKSADASSAALPSETAAVATSAVGYPDDYRTTFTNYLSLDRVQNPDQVIRLFANDLALSGPDDEGRLPFGSVIVGEVYKAKLDETGAVAVSSLGRRIRGDLALIAVMERGEHLGGGHPEALQNGHWEFAAFKPDGAPAEKDLNTCRACHAPLQATDHLFSLDHLK